MATRQYIGARYVPKFYTNSVDGSAAWESNVVYEPLTFVTLTNGHMYISKKQVPATVGTPASNVDYWLDMGSYNGFIEALQNEIDVINAKLYVTPDDYTGTDTQKLQAALDAAKDNKIVVIDRTYNVNGALELTSDETSKQRITVIGVGSEAAIVSTANKLFQNTSGTISSGYEFENIYFKGDGTNTCLYDTDIVRVGFDNCTFQNFVNVVDSPTFCQQLSMHHCLFSGNNGAAILIEESAVMVDIDNCYVEGGHSLLNHDETRGNGAVSALHITNCVIEGCSHAPIIVASSRGLVIKGNYFENNSIVEVIDLTEGSVSEGMEISHNVVYGNNDLAFIELPPYSNRLIGKIEYNDVKKGYMYFVKAYPDVPTTLIVNDDFNTYPSKMKTGSQAITITNSPSAIETAIQTDVSGIKTDLYSGTRYASGSSIATDFYAKLTANYMKSPISVHGNLINTEFGEDSEGVGWIMRESATYLAVMLTLASGNVVKFAVKNDGTILSKYKITATPVV